MRDAFLLVGAIFIGITAYSLFSKKDFSYLGATLTMGFFVIFGACLLAAVDRKRDLSRWRWPAPARCWRPGFLLYNTSLILKGDMDDPVGDALGLLVQLRNLFMFTPADPDVQALGAIQPVRGIRILPRARTRGGGARPPRSPRRRCAAQLRSARRAGRRTRSAPRPRAARVRSAR